jgi:RpiR family transcriptional regulator, carbohydrate utilization regulator
MLADHKDTPFYIKVKSLYPGLRESEKKVGDYILAGIGALLDKSLAEIASQVGVSEATVIRFCRQVGFNGFSEMKLKLAVELGQRSIEPRMDTKDMIISREDPIGSIPQKVISQTILALEDTLRLFSSHGCEDYSAAVEAIGKADHIDLYGVANSASIADDMMNKFIRIGIKCHVFADSHLQIMSAVALKKGDIAVGISHSGVTLETVEALKEARKAGATTICITNYSKSPITRYSDICLFTANYETSYFSETMVSRIAQLAIVDMLYLGVILTDYDKYTSMIGKINQATNKKAL